MKLNEIATGPQARETIQKLSKALNLTPYVRPGEEGVNVVHFGPIVYDKIRELRRAPYIIDQVTGVVPYTWFEHKMDDGTRNKCVRYDLPDCVVTLETEYMQDHILQMAIKVFSRVVE